MTPTSNLRTKVSVCVVTYNQEQYIAQCLQSLVDQTTNFDFEIIVSDDCSKDSTREIVRSFQARYPNLIRAYLHETNMGAYRNYLYTHEQAEGDYIAHVDGDDYCLPGKLQAQADLLDSHPEFNIVWHLVDVLQPDGRKKPLPAPRGEGYRLFTKADQINYITIACNSSKMYRRVVRDVAIPPSGFIDFYLNAVQLTTGNGALLLGRPYGVYREGLGIATAGTTTRRILLGNLEWLLRHEPEFRQEIMAATLHLFLSDIKNKVSTLPVTTKLLLRIRSLAGIALYVRTLSIRRSLKF